MSKFLMYTISGGSPDGEVIEGEAEEKTAEQLAAEAEALEAAKPITAQQLNEYLATRDTALVNTMQQGMVQIVQQMLEQNPRGPVNAQPSEEEVQREAQRAQAELNLSPEEFWRNPAAAMQKFYEAKVAPLKTELAKRPVQQNNDAAMTALAETRVQGLWNRLSEDDKKRYGPYLTEVVKQTDTRILADPKGIDSVWRLTKSHADEHIEAQETARTNRNQKANMLGGGGGKPPVAEKVTLDATEAAIAEAFGMSPELYRKHSTVTEVEPGANRNRKK